MDVGFLPYITLLCILVGASTETALDEDAEELLRQFEVQARNLQQLKRGKNWYESMYHLYQLIN